MGCDRVKLSRFKYLQVQTNKYFNLNQFLKWSVSMFSMTDPLILECTDSMNIVCQSCFKPLLSSQNLSKSQHFYLCESHVILHVLPSLTFRLWRAFHCLSNLSIRVDDEKGTPGKPINRGLPQASHGINLRQFKEAIRHFSHESAVLIVHKQNIIYIKARLNGIMHEQTIICRQLIGALVVGFRPVERKKIVHRMITPVVEKPGLKFGTT